MITRQHLAGDVQLRTLPNGQKDLRYTEGVGEYTLEKLSARFKFWLGEWFADTREGFPYRERVFAKGAGLQELRGLFVTACRQVPTVSRVVRMLLTFDPVARHLAVDFELVLVDGSVIILDSSRDARFILAVQAPAGVV